MREEERAAGAATACLGAMAMAVWWQDRCASRWEGIREAGEGEYRVRGARREG